MKIKNDHPMKCIRVCSVLPDFPAWKAGVRAGDEIIAVNDKSISDPVNKKFLNDMQVLPFSLLVKRGNQLLEFFVKE